MESHIYRKYVEMAEIASKDGRCLEAFLIQSCVIESVLKMYAHKKLSLIFSQTPSLRKQFENPKIAPILDYLLISKKISSGLYENLKKYNKMRNRVVHDLLNFDDTNALNKELQKIYQSGSQMKGFIVDDIVNELNEGKSVAELRAEIIVHLRELMQVHENILPSRPALAASIRNQSTALLEQLQSLDSLREE